VQESASVEAVTGPIVDAAWLRAHAGASGLRVVDTRPVGHYLMGHIPGAVSIDVNAIRMADSFPDGIADFVEQATSALRRAGVRTGEQVVFYEDFSGAAAARGVWMLDALGHPGGSMLDGGLRAWLEAGGSLTRDVPAVEASDPAVALDRTAIATAEEIRQAVAGGDRLTIIDTRNDLEYRAGTIPGATHVEWLRNLRPDGTLRSVTELRELYDGLGIRQEQPVATFCGSGYRAAHTYLVLKLLGYRTVKNYAPSWREWGRRADLPVERPVAASR
jgi:thiosulfate/3-mercaptopyruvate sulfurtransferase